MLQLITGPTAAPLDIADVRSHLRVPFTNDDDLIAAMLEAAVDHAEGVTHKQFVAARWKQVLDGFPGQGSTGIVYGVPFARPANAIYLEAGPVLDIVSIRYLDMGGTWRTIGVDDPMQYVVDYASDPVRLTPVFGQIWPTPTMPQIGSVEIVFDAGMMAPIAVPTSGSPPTPTGAIAVSGWKALAVGDAVRFSNSGGALPAPLQKKTDYFVKTVVSPGVYTFAASSGGSAITLTSTGTGTSYLGQLPGNLNAWLKLRLAALYENREELAQSITIAPIPFVDRLLDKHTTWEF